MGAAIAAVGHICRLQSIKQHHKSNAFSLDDSFFRSSQAWLTIQHSAGIEALVTYVTECCKLEHCTRRFLCSAQALLVFAA